MSQEAPQKPIIGGFSPLQEPVVQRLTDRAQTAAEDLRQLKDNQQKIKELDATGLPHPSKEVVAHYAGSVIEGALMKIDRAVLQRQANKTERAARRHFKKHEGDYQARALMEANEAGADIKGWRYLHWEPWDLTKHPKYKKHD